MYNSKDVCIDYRECLKVKVLSLAAELKIIRKEMKNQKYEISILGRHLRNVVKPACREANIAYALVKGKLYSQIETKPKTEPNWKRIAVMLMKFGFIDDSWHYRRFSSSPLGEEERKRILEYYSILAERDLTEFKTEIPTHIR